MLAETPQEERIIPPKVEPPITGPGTKTIESGEKSGLSLDEAQAELNAIRKKITKQQKVQVSFSWLIEEESGK